MAVVLKRWEWADDTDHEHLVRIAVIGGRLDNYRATMATAAMWTTAYENMRVRSNGI